MKNLSSVITAVLLFAANVAVSQTQTNDAAGAGSAPAIVDKLRAILAIQQRLADSNERAVQNGKGETDGHYKLALAKARFRLARELGEHDEQIAALKDILKVQQARLEDAKKRAEVGSVSPSDVDIIRVAVLEAEVKVLRAQRNSKKP